MFRMVSPMGLLGRALIVVVVLHGLGPVPGWTQEADEDAGPNALEVQEAKDKAADREHMMAIWKALVDYRQAKGRLPNYLSELGPEFLPDRSVLFSPMRDSRIYLTDPKLKTPYVYEFRAEPMGEGQPTYYEAKPDQLKEYGEAIVPILRCYSHEATMNITYSGEYYEAQNNWADCAFVRETIRTKGLGPGLDRGDFVDLRIVEEFTGQPVVGAEVRLGRRKIYTDMPLPSRALKTDAEGRVRVPLGVATPTTQRSVVVSVSKAGWCGPSEFWEDGRLPEGEQTWRLQPATSVGGVVRKSDGTALAGALVAVWVWPGFRKGGAPPPNAEIVPRFADGCFTDADGRWHCDSVPPDFTEMTVQVEHYDMWAREYRTGPAGEAPRRGAGERPTVVAQRLDRARLLAQKAELWLESRVALPVLL